MRSAVATLIVLVLAIAGGLAAAVTGASTASAASWAWCSSGSEGTWQPGFGPWFIQNDAWNGGHGPQRICADSYHHWASVSTQAKGNTAVETYPNSQHNFGTAAGAKSDIPFSRFWMINSQFDITMPKGAGISAEAAYDVWLGKGWNTTYEIMIWVNTVNRSMAGSKYLGSAKIYGQAFGVYEYPGSPPEFVFRLDHNELRGWAHIQASVQWLVTRHLVNPAAGLTAVPFGFEICSTDGVPKTFTVNNLTLNTGLRGSRNRPEPGKEVNGLWPAVHHTLSAGQGWLQGRRGAGLRHRPGEQAQRDQAERGVREPPGPAGSRPAALQGRQEGQDGGSQEEHPGSAPGRHELSSTVTSPTSTLTVEPEASV
jgi:hypothetical protein